MNNAGTPGSGSHFENCTAKDILDEVSVHCVGPLICAQACADALRRANGSIINITSRLGSIERTVSGEFASMKLSYSYRVAKAAQNMLTVCLAQDPELSGITVCGLQPGRLKTGCGMPDAPTDPSEAAERFLSWCGRIDPSRNNKCFDLYEGEMKW